MAGIAQLVEQRIRNAKVVGSIPISGTITTLQYRSKYGFSLVSKVFTYVKIFVC